MQHETLELIARRYAPVMHMDNGNKIVIPAESFAIGDILTTPPDELYRQLRAWQEFRRNPPSDLKKMLFELKDYYIVQTQEMAANGKYKTKKAKLLDLSPAELRFALLRKLFAEKDSYNLWNSGCHAVRKAHTGKRVLTGEVKAMERGGRGNLTYYSVNVTNPFELPEWYRCLCEDSRWTDAKEGGTGISEACTHAAALQTYAYNNPKLVGNSAKALASGKELFLPFHFRQPQQHDLSNHGIEREVLEYLSAQSLDLSHLKMDVLIYHLFNKTTYFEIGKKLLLIPDIYDPMLLEAVFNGRVFYETIKHENVKRGNNEQKFLEMDKMVRKMMHLLTQSGYELKGHPLEFRDPRDSKWETVSWHYEKGNKIVRIVPNEKFPPVFVYREKGNDAINPFLFEDYGGDYHPYNNLFGKERRIDDRTKQVTDFEVRIPTGIKMPPSLKEWYKETIAENFEGGVEGVVSRVKERSTARGIELARSLSY